MPTFLFYKLIVNNFGLIIKSYRLLIFILFITTGNDIINVLAISSKENFCLILSYLIACKGLMQYIIIFLYEKNRKVRWYYARKS